VPWATLVALVSLHAPATKTGRPPLPAETMLRIHVMQLRFAHTDPAMEQPLRDVPMFREFAGPGWDKRLPDASTNLRLLQLLKEHKPAERILANVNALLPDKARTLEAGTVVDANALLQGEESDAFGVAGRQSAGERPDPKNDVEWPIAMRPGKRRALAPDKTKPTDALVAEIERQKAGVRA
jgi:hypothetical protein